MNIQIISGTINITNLPRFLKQLADIGEHHNITVQAVNAGALRALLDRGNTLCTLWQNRKNRLYR